MQSSASSAAPLMFNLTYHSSADSSLVYPFLLLWRGGTVSICFKKHVMDGWCVHTCSLFDVHISQWAQVLRISCFFVAPALVYHLTEELTGGKNNR